MRSARKLALLALAATTATAVIASSASATEAVEVVNEKTGQHCALSGVYKCTFVGRGVTELRVDLGIFGEAHEATCNVEILFHVNEVGEGLVESVDNTPGDPNCPTVAPPCSLPWSFEGEEDGPAGVLQSSANVCVDPAEGPVCQGNLGFDIVHVGSEHYEVHFINTPVGLCKLDLDVELEGSAPSHAAIHINHP